jgi:hypothetical protein
MKPTPSILRPVGHAPVAKAIPANQCIQPANPGLARETFQLRTQGVLDYLVGTLFKTW